MCPAGCARGPAVLLRPPQEGRRGRPRGPEPPPLPLPPRRRHPLCPRVRGPRGSRDGVGAAEGVGCRRWSPGSGLSHEAGNLGAGPGQACRAFVGGGGSQDRGCRSVCFSVAREPTGSCSLEVLLSAAGRGRGPRSVPGTRLTCLLLAQCALSARTEGACRSLCPSPAGPHVPRGRCALGARC